MREVLFRGKADKGEWLEGQLVHFKASVGTGKIAVIFEGRVGNDPVSVSVRVGLKSFLEEERKDDDH